jgi:hypothetical protein
MDSVTTFWTLSSFFYNKYGRVPWFRGLSRFIFGFIFAKTFYNKHLFYFVYVVEFLQKISSTTLRYATQHVIKLKIFWSTQRSSESTPCYTLQLPTVPHSAEFQLRAIRQSAELQLRAMRQSAESRLRAMRQRAELQLRAMRHSAATFPAVPHSAESHMILNILAKSKPNLKVF